MLMLGQDTAVPPLESVEKILRQSSRYAGPTDESNWVIPGCLLGKARFNLLALPTLCSRHNMASGSYPPKSYYLLRNACSLALNTYISLDLSN